MVLFLKRKDGKMNDLELKHIRERYNVPAKIDGRIEYKSRPGIIVGAKNGHLKIRLDGEIKIKSYHPTWEIEYY